VRKLLLSVCLVLCAGTAGAATPVAVSEAWFRALPGGLPAGGYFTAANTTGAEIVLTGARSEACGMLMLHKSQNRGGMSGMDMVDKVVIAAHGTVRFAPGGYHLMCSDPRLKIGGRAPVILDFSNGVHIPVAFAVRGATGK